MTLAIIHEVGFTGAAAGDKLQFSGGVQCTICFAPLSHPKYLRVHMRNVHGNEKKRGNHYAKQVSLNLIHVHLD